jgi:hypothetical protein
MVTLPIALVSAPSASIHVVIATLEAVIHQAIVLCGGPVGTLTEVVAILRDVKAHPEKKPLEVALGDIARLIASHYQTVR